MTQGENVEHSQKWVRACACRPIHSNIRNASPAKGDPRRAGNVAWLGMASGEWCKVHGIARHGKAWHVMAHGALRLAHGACHVMVRGAGTDTGGEDWDGGLGGEIVSVDWEGGLAGG